MADKADSDGIARRNSKAVVIFLGATTVFFSIVSVFYLRLPFDRGNKEAANENSFVKQEKPFTCGVAALKMVLDKNGISRSSSEIEKALHIGGEGVSMFHLKEYAKECGLDAQGWRVSFDDLPRVPTPAILFIRKGHYVVLDSIAQKRNCFIRDPSFGPMLVSREQLDAVWSGKILIFSKH